MKVVAIIQARISSTRLPAKVLRPLASEPMLVRVVERVRRARQIHECMIATTTQPADDELAQFCVERGWPFFRGSEHDVLDRYLQAARAISADVVVRITSDCPLIDPGLLDEAVNRYFAGQPALDYFCNFIPQRTYPRGLDTEVFGLATLERCHASARNPENREHVTSYIYQRPDLFQVAGMMHERDCSGYRWTVDTPEDFALVEKIYTHFGHADFTWSEALALVERNPGWSELNREIVQKPLPSPV